MASPKLRFKEFDEDWSDSKLGQLIGISSASRVFKEQWQTSGVPFFRTSDVVSISKNKENEKAYISLELFEELSKKSGKIQKGDLLVTGGGTIGIPYLVKNDEPLYFKDADLLWMKSSGIIDGSFLYNFFISPKFREYLKSISHTGTISHFTIEQAKVTPFQYPSKEEQTKIATFLSAVDEKISQLSQKLHLLGQYKQGMMQKLFSQQIRFKADDGSEFGEWDEYSLDTLLSKIIDNRGKTPVTEANLEIPLIEVNAIGQRRIKYEKVSKYFSEDTFQNWFRAYLEHQDILFSTVGNTAICSIYTDEIKAGIAQNIVGLRANTKLIQPTFLYYLLTEISNNQKFKSIEMQAVQPSIKVSQMIHLTFLTPCLEEQTKIANFLSSIDQKIEVTAQQIEQAKQWKKGLLQQMFV